MTQEKGSVGAFYNIYNGMHFFLNFELFHQMTINQTKAKIMFKKILHALNQIRGLLALFFLKYWLYGGER